MKRSVLLLCAALLAVAAPLAPAQQPGDSVPIDFFYDALSPYGDWIYTPNYGYVWQPLAAQQPGWAPYADGSWAFTDAGWTWLSNEDFGWVTYHYGRWILMQQNWVWVPGNEWAPAWVSWRQTQGQIGWAPLPPEAAWSPGIGFGGWTDSYYDVGPAYYNFVPIGMFSSRTSLRPFILDRRRNFSYYDQSVNVTHTSYQQNVMHHIFVGGPDPQRIDGLGGNQVRRLSLRQDEEGFRRDWLDHRPGGGPPRGASSPFRIEQDQLIVAAPSIRRDASHGLPARVRESLQQPVIDRGWRGAGDAQTADQLRQRQRDELARTRPPNLPEKTLLPATSVTPPPALGRVLQPDERIGAGGARQTEPRHVTEEARPKTPLSPNTPPGIPGRKPEEVVNGGIVPQPGLPHREHRTEGQQPGMASPVKTLSRKGTHPLFRKGPEVSSLSPERHRRVCPMLLPCILDLQAIRHSSPGIFLSSSPVHHRWHHLMSTRHPCRRRILSPRPFTRCHRKVEMLHTSRPSLRLITLRRRIPLVVGENREAMGADVVSPMLHSETATHPAGKAGTNSSTTATTMKTKLKKSYNEGKIGWVLLWLLGIPLPVLLLFYLLGGGHH